MFSEGPEPHIRSPSHARVSVVRKLLVLDEVLCSSISFHP